MVEAKCEGGDVDIKIHGNVIEIGADILTIAHSIYVDMFNEDVQMALIMRDLMEKNFHKVFVVDKEEMDGSSN